MTNSIYTITMGKLITLSKETYGNTEVEADLHAEAINERKQAIENVAQQALCLDSVEAAEHLACHGMQPNHLFGEDLEIPTKEATAAVINFSGNSPNKKNTKSLAGVQRTTSN